MPDETTIRQALETVKYPGFSRDIVSFGLVREIKIEGSKVTVQLSFETRDPKIPQAINLDARGALMQVEGVKDVQLDFDIKEPVEQPKQQQQATQFEAATIPGVKKVICVASGKGGVGKSTVAANLAIALSKAGNQVGLCDCDIHGPSISLMFDAKDEPQFTAEGKCLPHNRHGIQLISTGMLVDDATPIIWRGPMIHKQVRTFLFDVMWDDLDYLVLDMPPGTGDVPLTLAQTIQVTGVVIVTTPQEVALIDARKAAAMFGKVNVPIVGLIENMSYFLCPNDGNKYAIFGEGGGTKEAERLGVPLLGQIPLEMAIREGGDAGRPAALDADSATGKAFAEIAAKLTNVL
ncbi:MAG: ATP-binding protein involved in chromosome partitioning [Verrucomicrobiales bacterium]|jgi:ATP-binding protein involved in chromosome partitioning